MKKNAVFFVAGLLLSMVLEGQQVNNSIDLTKGLVAYYPFWGNTRDESGNLHHGTANGATVTHGMCESTQGAFSFTGAKNILSFSGTQLAEPYLTVCSRIKITDVSKDPVFLCTSSSLKVLIKIVNQRYRVELAMGVHKYILYDKKGLFEIDPQHPRFDFLVFYYDGTRINLAINGREIDSQKLISKILPDFPITLKNDIVYSFYGVIDDIRIYNRLLSENELKLLESDYNFISPSVKIDSIGHIANDSAIVYSSVRFLYPVKDIFHFRVYWDTLPNPHSQYIDSWSSNILQTHLSHLKPNTTYYVTTYYLKECKRVASATSSFKTLPRIMYGSLTDVDGNTYKTVQIGNQVWMAENLRTTKYKDGTGIPLIEDNGTWASLLTPAYSWYNNDPAAFKVPYGALYNWYTVNTANLCPAEWHIPTDAEWTTLMTYLGGESVAGGKLKETGIMHWESPNAGATNETGFTAVASGHRSMEGYFENLKLDGLYWLGTEQDEDDAQTRFVTYSTANVWSSLANKKIGFSVRCLKDVPEVDLQRGLVAYYPFNGSANDESGKNHNGVVYGAALTTDRFENSNSAYDFNGLDNFIEIADNPDINFGKSINFTIAFWFKLDKKEPQGAYGILTKGTQTSDVYGFDLPFGENALVRFIMGKENGAAVLYRDDIPSVDDGRWHFVSGIAIRNSNTMQLYQDGIKIHELTTLGLEDLIMSSEASLKIGVSRLFTSFFGGKLDDIRLYTRELNPAEIMALYTENPPASIQTEKATNIQEELITTGGLPTETSDPLHESVEIYPNPANTLLFFRNVTGNTRVSIYDIQGREVVSSIITGNQIDIGRLEYGIYTVRIEDHNNIVIRKLIKQ